MNEDTEFLAFVGKRLAEGESASPALLARLRDERQSAAAECKWQPGMKRMLLAASLCIITGGYLVLSSAIEYYRDNQRSANLTDIITLLQAADVADGESETSTTLVATDDTSLSDRILNWQDAPFVASSQEN